MSLYQRGRIWWVKLTVRGRPPTRESTGTADRTAAQEYHDRRAAELWRTVRLGERPRVAFADAAADWIEQHARHKRSFATDRLRLKIMLPLLPERLDELTTTAMTRVRERLRADRGIGASSANKYLAVLSAILRHAHRHERIDHVPHVPVVRAPKRHYAALTNKQITALLAALPPHLEAIARFGLLTGLRDANLRGLKWHQVDLGARLLHVPPADAKAGETITVPLNTQAVAVLRAQLGRHPEHVFVYERLRKRNGKTVTERVPITGRSNNTAWRKAREKAGLPGLRVHDLRHTWATRHAAAGTPDLALQALGGWKDSRMVRNYTHLVARDLAPHAAAVRLPRGTKRGTVQKRKSAPKGALSSGVADGIRTHNNWNHKPPASAVVPLRSTVYAKAGRPKTG